MNTVQFEVIFPLGEAWYLARVTSVRLGCVVAWRTQISRIGEGFIVDVGTRRFLTTPVVNVAA